MSAPKQITVRGVTYPSYQEAAIALGVSHSAICKAALRGTLDRVGRPDLHIDKRPKPGERRAARPVRIQGVLYPSQRVAAEVLGVSDQAISSAKKRGALATVGDRQRRVRS